MALTRNQKRIWQPGTGRKMVAERAAGNSSKKNGVQVMEALYYLYIDLPMAVNQQKCVKLDFFLRLAKHY